MFRALSSRTGALVAAWDVKCDDAELDSFSCPACYSPVVLRLPRIDAGPQAHFAHLDATICDGTELGPWGEAALALWEARLALSPACTGTRRVIGPLGLPCIAADGIDPGRFEVFPERPRPSHLHKSLNFRTVLTFPLEIVPGEEALTSEGLTVDVPDRLAPSLIQQHVAVTDGVTLVYGKAAPLIGHWEAVGRAHPILGRAYVDTGGYARSRVILTNPKWFDTLNGLRPVDLPPPKPEPDDGPFDDCRDAMNTLER